MGEKRITVAELTKWLSRLPQEAEGFNSRGQAVPNECCCPHRGGTIVNSPKAGIFIVICLLLCFWLCYVLKMSRSRK